MIRAYLAIENIAYMLFWIRVIWLLWKRPLFRSLFGGVLAMVWGDRQVRLTASNLRITVTTTGVTEAATPSGSGGERE